MLKTPPLSGIGDVGAVMPQGGVMVEADRAVLDYLRGAIIRLDDNA
ncbi:Uncharacterised protein [Cedecea davisae]|uniref:Uncharacterized protein n=1 Tax=Cedecea davisae DSM 4568 TaxID=566551 RepID=S3IY45_9ENTR|nr:hypothetical protein [Cedecea davisae]EPF17885.1 hypothetical protein HMPREF0201_01869 [Cedecea davisae DSM 4568]SUX27910.1 Uncharacterised protein [Cedecea davisae]